jgi:mono/diheme cytochrome c family protein
MRSRLLCILGSLLVLGTTRSVSAQHEYPATDVENGGRLFLATCATCHGPDGDGVAGVDLGRGQFRRAAGASDEELVRIIRSRGTPFEAKRFSKGRAAARAAIE